MAGLRAMGARALCCWAAAALLCGAAPATAAPAHILVELTFPELAYDKLSAFQPLKRMFEDRVRQSIVASSGVGNRLEMTTSADGGAVRIDAKVYVAAVGQTATAYTTLAYSPSFITDLTNSVRRMSDLRLVSSGSPISVQHRVETIAPTCSGYVCPRSYADKPAASAGCANGQCTRAQCCDYRPTPAPRRPNILVALTFPELDYNRLSADGHMKGLFEDAVRRAVLASSGPGTRLDLNTSAGSVRASAKVYVVDASQSQGVYQTLAYSQSFIDDVNRNVRGIRNIHSVATGDTISVQRSVQAEAATCGWFACPMNYARNVLPSHQCTNDQCTTVQCCTYRPTAVPTGAAATTAAPSSSSNVIVIVLIVAGVLLGVGIVAALGAFYTGALRCGGRSPRGGGAETARVVAMQERPAEEAPAAAEEAPEEPEKVAPPPPPEAAAATDEEEVEEEVEQNDEKDGKLRWV